MLNVDANYVTNIIGSFELFLNQYVIAPYNEAVTGTTYSQQLTCEMDDPDDYSTQDKVPVILFDFPDDLTSPVSTGLGDQEVWVYPHFAMKVYPGLANDPVTNAEKPARLSAALLRSLFANISTALLVPLYDLTQSSTNPVSFAYIDSARVMATGGTMKELLALEKYRFNFDLRLRFIVATLNG